MRASPKARLARRVRFRPGGSYGSYFAGRLATGMGTLLVVSIVVFAGIHLIPGSYAQVVLPPEAPPAVRAHLEEEFGLDQTLPVQYLKWLENVASGNLGESLDAGYPVSQVLERRVPVTVELALLALLIAVVVGLPLALLAGMSRSRLGRGGSRLGGAIAMSTPDFVTGSLLLYVFSRWALGLRVGDYVPFFDDPIENLRGMLLPALTLSVFGIALIIRSGRDAVASVLSDPHVTAAIARGETLPHIVRHHVLRNAAVPILTVVAVYAGYLLGGAVVAESLFTLPGLGQGALLAITGRDYPVVLGVVLVGAAAFIAINMLADISYGLIDPRVRTARRG
jgi:peptide/nickel transport system permease protein